MSIKQEHEFKCQNCAASLKFEPGADSLVCPYCGTKNKIEVADEVIQEIDYQDFIANKLAKEDTQEIITVKCNICAAEVTLKPNVTSDECPFCGTSLVVTNTKSKKILKPKSLLPFKVTRKESQEHFRNWLGSIWFAPNKLKQYARSEEGLQGVYLPYWTYDCLTESSYSGQRGDNYYETETYTDTDANGNSVTKTRQVMRTNWYHVSGNVGNTFDDVLVMASNSLPRNYADALEPWDLISIVPYKDDYLSGFRTESYQVPLEQGFEIAKDFIKDEIDITIRNDIGGDQQRIDRINTSYDDITFKHILLPVWISAYRYHDKVYRFMVNARTGEVQGERPYSTIKIALAVILGLLILGIIFYFSQDGTTTARVRVR